MDGFEEASPFIPILLIALKFLLFINRHAVAKTTTMKKTLLFLCALLFATVGYAQINRTLFGLTLGKTTRTQLVAKFKAMGATEFHKIGYDVNGKEIKNYGQWLETYPQLGKDPKVNKLALAGYWWTDFRAYYTHVGHMLRGIDVSASSFAFSDIKKKLDAKYGQYKAVDTGIYVMYSDGKTGVILTLSSGSTNLYYTDLTGRLKTPVGQENDEL